MVTRGHSPGHWRTVRRPCLLFSHLIWDTCSTATGAFEYSTSFPNQVVELACGALCGNHITVFRFPSFHSTRFALVRVLSPLSYNAAPVHMQHHLFRLLASRVPYVTASSRIVPLALSSFCLVQHPWCLLLLMRLIRSGGTLCIFLFF